MREKTLCYKVQMSCRYFPCIELDKLAYVLEPSTDVIFTATSSQCHDLFVSPKMHPTLSTRPCYVMCLPPPGGKTSSLPSALWFTDQPHRQEDPEFATKHRQVLHPARGSQNARISCSDRSTRRRKPQSSRDLVAVHGNVPVIQPLSMVAHILERQP